jgi:hypothetical protein
MKMADIDEEVLEHRHGLCICDSRSHHAAKEVVPGVTDLLFYLN